MATVESQEASWPDWPSQSRPPEHSGGRLSPAGHFANWRLVAELAVPPPHAIGIFDDVLTTGSQFKAAKHLLQARFPGAPIVGIFIARCVRP